MWLLPEFPGSELCQKGPPPPTAQSKPRERPLEPAAFKRQIVDQ